MVYTIQDFNRHINTRYKNKLKHKNRFDKTGHNIKFLLSLEEFISLFEPFKNDVRFYDKTQGEDYLCLSRVEDLGDYIIGNVFVSTLAKNAREAVLANPNANFSGRKHKAEFFEKQSKSFKEICHSQGTNNSQFGTCWIYSLNEKVNKKIQNIELNTYLSEGWIKGRKMSF